MINDVLFIIPARSGSKSVPNKNIKYLCNIPLLAYRIKQALSLTSKENVWLSTDSSEYAEIGKQYDANIPYLRPAVLASDQASSSDVIIDIQNYCEKRGLKFEFIALLEPTSPFVGKEELSDAISKLRSNEAAEAIVATKLVHTHTIFVQNESEYLVEMVTNLKNAKGLRRQDQNRQITPSGGFYISKWDSFKKNETFYTKRTLSYLLPDNMSLEIDNPLDFIWAEFLMEKGIIDTNKII